MMAVKSGYLAANTVLKAEKASRALTAREQERYTREVSRMCDVFVQLIKMFYDNRSFEVFMTPRPNRQMEWAVHNAVAGNTSTPLLLTLGLWGFYGVCALQRRFALVPRIDFAEPAAQ